MKLILTFFLFSGIALGQVNNYYVSLSGSDANTPASVLNSGGSIAWRTINHALTSGSFGASGKTIHVAAGTYNAPADDVGCFSSAVCFATGIGGVSATSRLVLQCDTPLQCFLNTTIWFNGTSGVNNIDVVGFDVGNMPSLQNGIATANNGSASNYNSIHVLGNFIHDVGQSVVFGGITGCINDGMVVLGSPHGSAFSNTDIQVIGNRLLNYGIVGNGCNNGQGIYMGSANSKVQNNIISGITTSGIEVFDQPCNTTITNNTIFNSGRGIQLSGGSGSCTGGHNTISNNILDSVVRGIMLGTGSGGACAVAGTTFMANNLLFGNTVNFLIGALSNPGNSSCETFSGNITSEPPATTFLNYLANGTGNYGLKAGSLAINGGTVSGVPGGSAPFVPVSDLAGITRPSPPSIGALEVAGAPVSHLAPAPTSFPSTLPGSCSAPQLVTVSNTGTGAFTITPDSTVTGANLADFQFAGTGTCSTGQNLNPTQSCLISLKFCPTSTSLETAQLNVFTTAPNGTQTSALSGTGTQPDGSIAASTGGGTLAFGNQAVNTVSGVLQGVLTSAGTGPLTITTISVSAPYVLFSDTCPRTPATMTPGQTCQINVKFNPLVSGSQPGTLTVSDNAISGNQTLSLTGTGQSPSGTGAVILGPVLITGGVVFNPQ